MIKLDKYEFLFVLMIIFFVVIIICGLSYQSQCVYKNVTGKIVNKSDEEYTTFVAISRGKGVSVVPVFHHDYYLDTDYGKLKVNKDKWDNYSVNDNISLVLNVNTSAISFN